MGRMLGDDALKVGDAGIPMEAPCCIMGMLIGPMLGDEKGCPCENDLGGEKPLGIVTAPSIFLCAPTPGCRGLSNYCRSAPRGFHYKSLPQRSKLS